MKINDLGGEVSVRVTQGRVNGGLKPPLQSSETQCGSGFQRIATLIIGVRKDTTLSTHTHVRACACVVRVRVRYACMRVRVRDACACTHTFSFRARVHAYTRVRKSQKYCSFLVKCDPPTSISSRFPSAARSRQTMV